MSYFQVSSTGCLKNSPCFVLQARIMFDGEMASLKAIAATNTVRVPAPITVLDLPKGGACIVLEYLDMKGSDNL